MGLYDDDFYSTKVSRRARTIKQQDFALPFNSGGRKWSNVKVAFVSSFTSAIAATLLFGVFFGGGADSGGGRSATATAGVVQTMDASERAIQASAKVRPAVVSIVNEQMYSLGG